jgi:hypothetical protein
VSASQPHLCRPNTGFQAGLGGRASTVSEILRAAGIDPAPRRHGPTGRQFLHAQAVGILAVDLLHVDHVLARSPGRSTRAVAVVSAWLVTPVAGSRAHRRTTISLPARARESAICVSSRPVFRAAAITACTHRTCSATPAQRKPRGGRSPSARAWLRRRQSPEWGNLTAGRRPKSPCAAARLVPHVARRQARRLRHGAIVRLGGAAHQRAAPG